MRSEAQNNKKVIGGNIFVDVLNFKKVPAKVDTGADSSAIWASSIKIAEDGTLKFKLFAPESQFYTGEVVETKDFKVVVTRSSHGDEKMFYRTHLPVKIDQKKINAMFTLSDRKNNNFPILIGRRTIANKFLVDVSKRVIVPSKNPKTAELNQELKQNPHQFYQKHSTN